MVVQGRGVLFHGQQVPFQRLYAVDRNHSAKVTSIWHMCTGEFFQGGSRVDDTHVHALDRRLDSLSTCYMYIYGLTWINSLGGMANRSTTLETLARYCNTTSLKPTWQAQPSSRSKFALRATPLECWNRPKWLPWSTRELNMDMLMKKKMLANSWETTYDPAGRREKARGAVTNPQMDKC